MKLRLAISIWLTLCVFLFAWVGGGFAQRRVLLSLEQDITSLVESVKPSLVTIETASQISKDRQKAAPSTFVGSGVIYTADGYILTSASVVAGMKSFKVTLPDKDSFTGKLVGTDEESNLAVLKVETAGLTPAKLGNSDMVKVGSWLTVVGNSYGLPNAVALGLVNGVRKDGFIQMSANVSPGNSGGPVLDTYGNVIGLVAAKLSEQSYISAVRVYDEKKKAITIPSRLIEIPSSGISLALPINKVKTVADEIIKYGNLRRGYLGIYPQNLPANLRQAHALDKGVLVAQVVKGSPADRSGLSDGDIIIEFGGAQVIDGDHIRQLIKSKRADEAVELKILRDNDAKELLVVLGAAKPAYSYTWWTDVEAPEIPEPVSSKAYYEAAYDYLQEVEGGVLRERESVDELRLELQRLSEELKKMSQELERLKKEKAKE
jgi:S1-C subfamily serine protease